jgi:hypothetical protein
VLQIVAVQFAALLPEVIGGDGDLLLGDGRRLGSD